MEDDGDDVTLISRVRRVPRHVFRRFGVAVVMGCGIAGALGMGAPHVLSVAWVIGAIAMMLELVVAQDHSRGIISYPHRVQTRAIDRNDYRSLAGGRELIADDQRFPVEEVCALHVSGEHTIYVVLPNQTLALDVGADGAEVVAATLARSLGVKPQRAKDDDAATAGEITTSLVPAAATIVAIFCGMTAALFPGVWSVVAALVTIFVMAVARRWHDVVVVETERAALAERERERFGAYRDR